MTILEAIRMDRDSLKLLLIFSKSALESLDAAAHPNRSSYINFIIRDESDLLKNLQEILTGLDLELLQNSEQQKSSL